MSGPTTPKEFLQLEHNQWLSEPKSKGLIANLKRQKEDAITQAMNLTDSRELTLEKLLPSLIKAKTLKELIEYVETNPESTS